MKSVKTDLYFGAWGTDTKCPYCGSTNVNSFQIGLNGQTPGNGESSPFFGVFDQWIDVADGRCKDHISGKMLICKSCKEIFFVYNESDTRSCWECHHRDPKSHNLKCLWNYDLRTSDSSITCPFMDQRSKNLDPRWRCVTCKHARINNTPSFIFSADSYRNRDQNQQILDYSITNRQLLTYCARHEEAQINDEPQLDDASLYQVPQYIECAVSGKSVCFRKNVCMSYEPSRKNYINYMRQCKAAGCLFSDIDFRFDDAPCDVQVRLHLPEGVTFAQFKATRKEAEFEPIPGCIWLLGSKGQPCKVDTDCVLTIPCEFISHQITSVSAPDDANYLYATVRFEGPMAKQALKAFIKKEMDFSYCFVRKDGESPDKTVHVIRWDLRPVNILEHPANHDHDYTLEDFGLSEKDFELDQASSNTVIME